jgi:hypothetical protein
MKLSKCTIKTPVRSDISTPSRIPERLGRHVRVSEGIDLSIYRPIFDRFRPVFTRHRQFLARLTRHHAPARFSAESDRFSPRRHSFLRLATHPHAPSDLSAQPPITALIPTGFRLTATNFSPSGPASAPLSTGANGERRIHSVAELGRSNTIYMSSGPSWPIFMFLIQFEFYPTKQSRFEKISPPMFLEFHLIFYIIF